MFDSRAKIISEAKAVKAGFPLLTTARETLRKQQQPGLNLHSAASESLSFRSDTQKRVKMSPGGFSPASCAKKRPPLAARSTIVQSVLVFFQIYHIPRAWCVHENRRRFFTNRETCLKRVFQFQLELFPLADSSQLSFALSIFFFDD